MSKDVRGMETIIMFVRSVCNLLHTIILNIGRYEQYIVRYYLISPIYIAIRYENPSFDMNEISDI